jgi:hypothetical protein
MQIFLASWAVVTYIHARLTYYLRFTSRVPFTISYYVTCITEAARLHE